MSADMIQVPFAWVVLLSVMGSIGAVVSLAGVAISAHIALEQLAEWYGRND